jgi:membrane protein
MAEGSRFVVVMDQIETQNRLLEQVSRPFAVSGTPNVSASPPTQLPAEGWVNIAKRIWHSFAEDRILALAAGVAFYGLLALFPAVGSLVSLYGLFTDPGSMATHLDSLSGILPSGGLDVLRDELTRVSATGHSTLSLAFLFSLGISLWSANAGMKALFDTLNVVFKEEERRGFFLLNAISLVFTVGTLVFAILALGATLVVPIVLNYVGLSGLTETLVKVFRWPVLLAVVGIWLSLIYRFGPDRKMPQWHWITLGSASAGVLWLVSSILFSWYAANFGSYNKTYGALGAIVGFMVWMWISIIVVLVGAELDAKGEREAKGKPDGGVGAKRN